MAKESVKIIVLGTGQRAKAYCQFLKHAEDVTGQVIAVAEPVVFRRQKFAAKYGVSEENCFDDWKDIAKLGPKAFGADGVLICTHDRMHKECVLAFSALGYDILCEKPMAPVFEDCQEILAAVQKGGRIFGMGHVLRYSPHNQTLKDLLQKRVIGDLININHTEPVGQKHFAHSYVRGNWRNEALSSFSLLAKSCHDIDIIQYFMGATSTADFKTHPTKISSMGSLTHFKKSNKPAKAGTAKKCFDCAFERDCPYSAKKIYYDTYVAHAPMKGFQTVVTDVEDAEAIKTALRETNYGTCVYEMDNDVCDNQVVNIQYTTPYGEASVSFTMIAFTEAECVRKTTMYGSTGELFADGKSTITVRDFVTNTTQTYNVDDEVGKHTNNSHGGGDHGLITAWIRALDGVKNGASVKEMQLKYLGCTPEETFESHKLVFKAENSRRQRTIEIL